MKKRVNLINRVSALVLPFFLALGLITPAFSITVNAEAVEVLESSATVADCVMSYYAMSGSAVANTDWINTLYSSLGSSFGTIGDFAEQGLMTYVDGTWQPVEQLAQNIASTSAYTELGLNNVFSVSAEEVASGGGYAVATGASTLAGAVGCVASNGILPVLGGVTAAYWGGIAIGTLISHLTGLYGKPIEQGLPIDTLSQALQDIPDGSTSVYAYYNFRGVRYIRIYSVPNTYSYSIDSGANNIIYGLQNLSQNQLSGIRINIDGNTYTKMNITINGRGSTTNSYSKADVPNGNTAANVFLSTNEYDNEKVKWFSGTSQPKKSYSPDVIGPNGNQNGSYNSNTGEYIVPDMKPQIDPQTQSGKPLSLQDWLQFANGVQNNNNSTSPVPNNTSLFQDILDAVKSLIPTPTPTPDPNPGGETYPIPGPVPDPSPVPDPDYQPETKPQPDYTEKATENETDITEGDPWTTPDLLDKFPFCIPRDVYRVFTKLDSGARAAPHIQWRFNPNNKIDYTFDIDFAEWDSIATLLRTLELLGFIVALAVATRKMILS